VLADGQVHFLDKSLRSIPDQACSAAGVRSVSISQPDGEDAPPVVAMAAVLRNGNGQVEEVTFRCVGGAPKSLLAAAAQWERKLQWWRSNAERKGTRMLGVC
jgi:hypothetical protein